MRITFHGAARTVTGSQHLLEVNGKRILLDSGLFQGRRKEAFARNRENFCDAATIDAVILSHAHIDHSGAVPCLVKNGFSGDIYATAATRDLCAAMLMDSAAIQERDVEYINRKQRGPEHKILFEPLYTKEDVVTTMEQFIGLSYNRSRQIFPGIHLTMVDAGHILGSANIILDIDDHDTGRRQRLLYSGDIGRAHIPIIRDPAPPTDGADILIMESTYGNQCHPAYQAAEDSLATIINETAGRGGSLLIPAFAVGRTQQIVYSLHKLFKEGRIPPLPVYVDSPLATRVTDIFRLHPEAYDAETRSFLLRDAHNDPFGFETLRYTRDVEESKEISMLSMPAIIISASGMMENGRILHHLKRRISDERTTILVTGWQAPNTLGRKIVENMPVVPILGREYALRARVENQPGFSCHADRQELLDWAGSMRLKPRHVFLVHGEEESSQSLAEALRTELGFANVEIPEPHQTFEL
ncbi:MAG: MBL fold metallo-hydrolase [Desulfobulbaceae bacterium]|nr:MBL fold metallo-hydrolase [Desulfobulbaceae bacterium]